MRSSGVRDSTLRIAAWSDTTGGAEAGARAGLRCARVGTGAGMPACTSMQGQELPLSPSHSHPT